MRILSVDPGKMTGYVVWTDGEREEGELAHEPFLDFAWDLVKAGDIDVIVCERFIITAQTGKLSQAPWSLEQIGALRFFAHRLGIPFELQSAADAKRFATEDKLRRAAWARPKGAGHARDAQRHLLVYLVRRNLFDASVLIGG